MEIISSDFEKSSFKLITRRDSDDFYETCLT